MGTRASHFTAPGEKRRAPRACLRMTPFYRERTFERRAWLGVHWHHCAATSQRALHAFHTTYGSPVFCTRTHRFLTSRNWRADVYSVRVDRNVAAWTYENLSTCRTVLRMVHRRERFLLWRSRRPFRWHVAFRSAFPTRLHFTVHAALPALTPLLAPATAIIFRLPPAPRGTPWRVNGRSGVSDANSPPFSLWAPVALAQALA